MALSSRNPPLWLLVALALTAFAANSLLARGALEGPRIDAASFTTIRILSGAATLWAILALRGGGFRRADVDWAAAGSLFGYAALFSFAYLSLDAGLGALALFGAVQTTMIGYGLWRGERTTPLGALGIGAAMLGLALLLAPGDAAPDAVGLTLMIGSGFCWGVYSLLGRGAANPVQATAANFIAAAPLALLLSAGAAAFSGAPVGDGIGLRLAALSGAAASGCGYVIWYAALPRLGATQAATLQLGAPALASVAGVLLLGEEVTWRLVIASIAILGGVALFFSQRQTMAADRKGERE